MLGLPNDFVHACDQLRAKAGRRALYNVSPGIHGRLRSKLRLFELRLLSVWNWRLWRGDGDLLCSGGAELRMRSRGGRADGDLLRSSSTRRDVLCSGRCSSRAELRLRRDLDELCAFDDRLNRLLSDDQRADDDLLRPTAHGSDDNLFPTQLCDSASRDCPRDN